MVKHERRYESLSTEELQDLYMSTRKRMRTIERLLATRNVNSAAPAFSKALVSTAR